MHWWVGFLIAVVIAIYNLIGAAIFQALEQPREQETLQKAISSRKVFLDNYTCVDVEGLKLLISAYDAAVSKGVSFNIDGNGSADIVYTPQPSNWDFASSLFFSMTVMTTIGYGNISPATSGGQVMVCIYAIIGIPLFGVFMTMIGEALGRQSGKIRKKLEESNCLKDKTKLADFIFFSILIVSGYLIFFAFPAIIFVFSEGWDYGTSLYYSMITLTTIGFGDYVAGQQARDGARVIYKILLYLWIYIGLCYMAMIIDQIATVYKKGVNKMEAQPDSAGKEDIELSGGTADTDKKSNSNFGFVSA